MKVSQGFEAEGEIWSDTPIKASVSIYSLQRMDLLGEMTYLMMR
jgi:hypothetical protein